MEAAWPAEPGELPPRTRGEPDPLPRPLRSPDSRLGQACRAREPRALRFPSGPDPGAQSPEPGAPARHRAGGVAQCGRWVCTRSRWVAQCAPTPRRDRRPARLVSSALR